MTYTVKNFKSGAELKRALKAGEVVTVYQPGPFGPDVSDGRVALEGPHYPEPHKWYLSGMVENGVLKSVK